jgi:hypothetical protein
LTFLWGFWEIGGGWGWFLDGVTVVECVVDVVFWQSCFWVWKIRHGFAIYSLAARFGRL